MNNIFDEKKVNEAQILNEDNLTNVVGGTGNDGYSFYYIGTFVCPFCKKEHTFRITLGDIMHGANFEPIPDEAPCDKIAYLSTIFSFDNASKTGTLRIRGTNGADVYVTFTMTGAYSNGNFIEL